jgi:hypothetical protein
MRAAAGSMRRKSITARYVFAAGNGLAINDARPGAQARRHATLARLRLAQGTAQLNEHAEAERSIKRRRKRASWDPQYMLEILGPLRC